ncbi:hypothetical protein OIU78_012638 [Salix suchowensis]|nr:hypothetical protein OIU78_012638 [Salix suchowensis]
MTRLSCWLKLKMKWRTCIICKPEMVKRNDIVASMIVELEHERMNLTHKVKNLMNQADVLVNWLRVNDAKSHGKKLEDDDIAFVAGDEDSRLLIESLATDRAIEDSMYALDKAVEQGVVSFDAYLKQHQVAECGQVGFKSWNVGEENGCPANAEIAVDHDHRTILTQIAVSGDVFCASLPAEHRKKYCVPRLQPAHINFQQANDKDYNHTSLN